MPRRKAEVPKVGFFCRIPKPLHDQVKIMLLDPVHLQIGSGELSNLMTRLLQRWVDEQILQHKEQLNG